MNKDQLISALSLCDDTSPEWKAIEQHFEELKRKKARKLELAIEWLVKCEDLIEEEESEYPTESEEKHDFMQRLRIVISNLQTKK